MDLAAVREQLYGRDAKLYDVLGDAIRLAGQEKKLENATKDFLVGVSAWKPGISKLLDLVKLIPGKQARILQMPLGNAPCGGDGIATFGIREGIPATQ
jgi:hypothetical protein